MLLAIIWLYLKTPDPHTFSINTLVHLDLPLNEQLGIFAAFFLAFAIKIPIFPFHSWQPDTYTVAPTAGSMLLAGLMAKMGLYGFIRILLPVCKPMVVMLSPYLIPLALTGLIYGSIIAIRQKEIKRLIAYSSFAHVGLMAAVLFTLNIDAWQGSVYQMLSHGFNVIALFFIADIIQNRTNTTKIADLGGIAKSAPRFAIFFMIVMLGSIAMPLTNGFIGEFMMLWGLAQYNILATSIAGLSIILGAVYMFWLYQKTMYGDTNNLTLEFKDLNTNELFVAVPLVIMIILMGVYPKPVFDLIKPALDTILSSI
jgi:NADH-quinone oxidoreductase subunit M